MKPSSVSLIISTYNSERYLELCLKSVLSLRQMPDEVVVADDGSGAATRAVVDAFRAQCPVPVVHVWQEDLGFRKCRILNKAILQCSSDYVVQIDGDIVMEPHFVIDHLSVARPNAFVCGSRVKLAEDFTMKLFSGERRGFGFFSLPPGYALNSLRCAALMHFLAPRYGQKKLDRLRGCNMAFWKSDLLKVNGYDEDLTQWGHEDGELAFRLYFAGVKKLSLKFGGVAYHLWHKESVRDGEVRHLEALERVKRERLVWCENGIVRAGE